MRTNVFNVRNDNSFFFFFLFFASLALAIDIYRMSRMWARTCVVIKSNDINTVFFCVCRFFAIKFELINVIRLFIIIQRRHIFSSFSRHWNLLLHEVISEMIFVYLSFSSSSYFFFVRSVAYHWIWIGCMHYLNWFQPHFSSSFNRIASIQLTSFSSFWQGQNWNSFDKSTDFNHLEREKNKMFLSIEKRKVIFLLNLM